MALRRATMIEKGLFEIQAEHLNGFRKARQVQPTSREIIYAMFGRDASVSFDHAPASDGTMTIGEAVPSAGARSVWIGSADMKRRCGAKSARSSLPPRTPWTAANHKREDGVFHPHFDLLAPDSSFPPDTELAHCFLRLANLPNYASRQSQEGLGRRFPQ